jgi:hypothetical protein
MADVLWKEEKTLLFGLGIDVVGSRISIVFQQVHWHNFL